MCGIAGIWNQANEATIAQMAQSVAHRGPDGLDWVIEGNNSLGASRLAIFGDPSASPIFHDAETGISVLFNGEIYNFSDLRTDLKKAGSVFHTNLESEVIAELYKHHGHDFTKRLKGMFAIAVLDGNKLVLTRDKLGIKPLYYICIDKKVVFGSELKSILAHPEVKVELNTAALNETTVFGYIYSPEKTMLKGVNQVKPGTTITFSNEGISEKIYWQAPHAAYLGADSTLGYDEAVSQLRQVVLETMDSLLKHGNYPIGAFLSGGIDSTILVLVAQKILGYPITTFTLADDDNSTDLLAARRVADKLGTRHIERIVTLDDCLNKLDHFVTHNESLMAGGVFDIYGGLSFHLLSETVSNHVKVAFSGEGADELFGGYYWTYTHSLGFSDRIRARLQACPGDDGDIGRLVRDLFPLPENERTYKRNLFDALIHGGLANYHLQSVDRSAGAYGFEIRPPYLSDDLVEFALNLPIEYKVPDKQVTKRILRDAFRPELEQLDLSWVLTRQKEGMPSALSKLAPLINQKLETNVSDSDFSRHPLRGYFQNKADCHLFNIFAHRFLRAENYALQHSIT